MVVDSGQHSSFQFRRGKLKQLGSVMHQFSMISLHILKYRISDTSSKSYLMHIGAADLEDACACYCHYHNQSDDYVSANEYPIAADTDDPANGRPRGVLGDCKS